MKRPIILCVDDQKEILDSLEEQIGRRLGDDFVVELAEGGEEALELIEDLIDDGEQKLAVIVSDHLMPGMKGDEFLIAAHAFVPDTLKILLTGQASLEAVRNVINEAKLYRYVEKPWEEDDLMLTIEEASKSYMQNLQLVEYNRLLRLLNQATQELSGEINIQSLFDKFMKSAMVTTGAEMGIFIVEDSGNFNVSAVSSIIQDEATKLRLKQLNENPELTQEVLTKVKETLNTKKDKDYRLASAVNKAGKNIGYVYLENTMTRETFDSIQREILQMLASQAAISIENANLYRSLTERSAELQAEKEKLDAVNKVIEEKNADIMASIRYARRIQEAIMPERASLQAVFPDSFALYLPKDIVSGDFYWWTDKIDRFLCAAVDCTGHGVPGAFMSVMASNFLNQIANEYTIYDPEVVLNYLNLRVRSTLRQDQDQASKDGMDLAFISIDTRSKVLDFAGARRPLHLIRKGELTTVHGTRLSIGETPIDGSEGFYESHSIQLEAGDCIYIFTDGLPDQYGGPDFRKYSPRRFRDLLLENHHHPMSIQAQIIEQSIRDWMGTHEQTDDILVIGLRITN